MARRASAPDLVRALPFLSTSKVTAGEGEIVHPFGLALTWKVKSEDTGFRFSVYEMTIQPGEQIPIHVHPYPEFFYVLEGRIETQSLDEEGLLVATPLAANECANVPLNTPHGIVNSSNEPARFLSVSTPEHEQSFNEYRVLLATPEGERLSEKEKSAALMDIFEKNQMIYLDADTR